MTSQDQFSPTSPSRRGPEVSPASAVPAPGESGDLTSEVIAGTGGSPVT